MDDLNACVDEIRFDEDIRGAVLVSDLPKFFSAGADINEFGKVARRRFGKVGHRKLLLRLEPSG